MKAHSHILSPFVARGIAAVCAAVFLAGAASTTLAAGVVGTGTPASCTDAALNTALAGGGLVTFNCGPDPVTIDISSTGTNTIAADTTIDGGGLITISGGNSAFLVNLGVKFTVQNLTVAGNHAQGHGGGIFSNGTVTVTNSTFSGNGADLGGGIYNGGTLTVTNSTFSDNSASGGGGGIFSNGTLTVTNSGFSGNNAPGETNSGGGGISNNDGTATLTDCTLRDNSADYGGGISTNGGTLTVTNSTFSGNGAFNGGGIVNDSGTLRVTNGTFSGNRALYGGGILNVSGALSVTNSTFSGNSAINSGGSGGGISTYGGTLTVTNSSFSGNGAFNGGGIFRDSAAAATLTNTIVANSTSGGNCAGSLTDGGHNLDDGTSCGFSAANGSMNDTDPQLDPAGLQDNGGPTETVALCTAVGVPAGCTAASPAIDAGDDSVCAAAPVNNLDQRGFARPGSGHTQCSIGAYEVDGAPLEACVGDCDGNSQVTIDELLTLVNIALGSAGASACPHGVASDAEVNVAVIIQAVHNALTGCGVGK